MRRLTILLLLAVAPASALAFDADTTTLVDGPGIGGLPSDQMSGVVGAASRDAVDHDGNRFVFWSGSDALLPAGVDPTTFPLYVRDRSAKTTTMVSATSAGVPLDDDAFNPVISGDGTVVAFLSEATNAPSGDGTRRAYVKNLTDGSLTLVSQGDQPAGATDVSINGDGTKIAFVTADSLDAADTNGGGDVYVRDVTAGTTTLVSRKDTAAGAVGGGGSPSINADGTKVAFQTLARLDPLDTNDGVDIYLRDGSTTALISARGDGTADGSSSDPSISDDGSAVAFASSSNDLVPADTNAAEDVFLRSGGTTTMVSRPNGSANGSAGTDEGSYAPSISGDGSRVAFLSTATNFVPDASGFGEEPYMRVVGSNATRLLSRASDGTPAEGYGERASLNGDGSAAAIVTSAQNIGFASGGASQMYARNDSAGTTELVSGPTGASAPGLLAQEGQAGGLSDDGRYALVRTVSKYNGVNEHLYLRDLLEGTYTEAAKGLGGAAPDGAIVASAISGDGSTIALQTDATNLIAGAPDYGVYTVDRATGAVELVSRAPGATGAPAAADGLTELLGVSRTGRYVLFSTRAALDPTADGNDKYDLYLRDRVEHTTTLISRGQTAPGTFDVDTRQGLLSADGRHVLFTSTANLDFDPGGVGSKVYMRDVDAELTRFVSRASGPGGEQSNQAAVAAAVNADGTKGYFLSQADNLGGGASGTFQEVYERDLVASTTRLVSRIGLDGAEGNGDTIAAQLSGDGTKLLLLTLASNLIAEGDAAIVVRDLAAGTYKVATRANGASSPLAMEIDPFGFINGPGNCVLFSAVGLGLAPGGYPSPDFGHTYLRTLFGTCPVPATEPPAEPPAESPTPGPTATASPTPGGNPTPPDATKPVISAATLSRARFRVGAKATAVTAVAARKKKRAKAGTTIRYTLSEAAKMRLAIARATKGRKAGKRCVKATKKNRKKKRCTRYGAVATLTRASKAGATSVAFSGRIARKALKPGSYRMVLRATDAAGNTSAKKTLRFKIVKK